MSVTRKKEADVDRTTIRIGLRGLGLQGADVAVHASLRSFGHVAGGEETVIAALRETCATLLMPAFCEIGRTNPPPDDRPERNGWYYQSYRIEEAGVRPFDPRTFGPDSDINVGEMGRIAAGLLREQDAIRSAHPSVSWTACGSRAAWYCEGHEPGDPNAPLKKLVQARGWVLLLGVGLASCTALHLAEERSGRRPFIRWIRYADGQVRRVREYGCSDGFPRLAPGVAAIARSMRVGACQAVAYPIAALVETATEILRRQPELTLCGRRTPCRCQDAVRGGPTDKDRA